jgi:hypothetical protein
MEGGARSSGAPLTVDALQDGAAGQQGSLAAGAGPGLDLRRLGVLCAGASTLLAGTRSA